VIAVLAFIACLRYRPGGRRRRDLVWLSAALPAGVIAQAAAGGIVALTREPGDGGGALPAVIGDPGRGGDAARAGG
jgi:hypothetical protein